MKIQLYFRLTDDTNIPTLSQQPDYLILLTKSRWDDYGFKVTFDKYQLKSKHVFITKTL